MLSVWLLQLLLVLLLLLRLHVLNRVVKKYGTGNFSYTAQLQWLAAVHGEVIPNTARVAGHDARHAVNLIDIINQLLLNCILGRLDKGTHMFILERRSTKCVTRIMAVLAICI